MNPTTKIGIIICDRYRRCAGGKCFRSMDGRGMAAPNCSLHGRCGYSGAL